MKSFPLYNPKNNKNDFNLFYINANISNNEILILIAEPLSEYENLSIEPHKKLYQHFIILFQSYYFNYDDKICNKISNFLFNRNAKMTLHLAFDIKSIYQDDLKYVGFFGDPEKKELAILDINKSRVKYKFKVKFKNNKDNNFTIDLNKIIDKNINIILKNICIKNDKNFDILIEEPYNIIFNYLRTFYNKSYIILLNGGKNDKIKSIISTEEKTEIKDYLFSYINKKENEKKFDLIISEMNPYLENHDSGNPKNKILKEKI